MRLLVTRPAPDGERTANELRKRGHEVIVAPLLRVDLIPLSLDAGPFAAAIITSSNAARAIADHPRREEIVRLPLFAVGRRSAEAARNAGFESVSSADGGADDLVRLVAARLAGSRLPLLYLAAEDRATDLGAALASHGIEVTTVTVYRAVPQPALPPDAATALSSGQIDGVLHYSRRSAEALVACAKAAGLLAPALALVHYCLSPEVAAPLAAEGAAAIKVAERPDEMSLFHLLSVG